ncbi:MAG: hypothetical protein K0U64_05535, partial [Actinomycetia bacterium]|nr:hypothetical protein [Actinomycetes bacterium]
FRSLMTVNAPLLLALGRPYLNALISWAIALVSFSAFFGIAANLPADDYGDAATAVAAAKAGVTGIVLVILVPLINHIGRISTIAFLRCVAWPVVAGVAAFVASSLVVSALDAGFGWPLVPGLLGVLAGGILAGGILLWKEPAVRQLLATLLRRIWPGHPRPN